VGQTEKAHHYQALKAAGVPFAKPYRQHTEAELREAHQALRAGLAVQAPPPAPKPVSAPPEAAQGPVLRTASPPGSATDVATDPAAAAFFGFEVATNAQDLAALPDPLLAPRPAPQDELAGARQNTREEWEVIRVDEEGRLWYQEEVKKPAYPKPRGRRVMRYSDPGVQTQTITDKDGTSETFEIPGDPSNARMAEVRITLPSYQVGVYADPRFPFRVITYNGNNGFHLDDVQDFYGGAELVPASVKRTYVENVLCYDVRTVVQAVQAEARQIQLRENAGIRT
jgi:hypothetical protein